MKKLLLILLLCPILSVGQIPSPLKNTYVHDYAHVLTAAEVEDLNRIIYNIDTSNKVKFAIILINELPDNYSIEDYARDIGNKWQVGKGIVYVAAINQRKQRLEVSSHLEGSIPDIKAKHITDNIKPYFKTKDYHGGLAGMIIEIDALIKADLALPKQPKAISGSETDSGAKWIIGLGLIFIAGGILFFILYRLRKHKKMLKERLEKEKEKIKAMQESIKYSSSTNKTYTPPKRQDNDYVPPIIYTPPTRSNDDDRRSSNNDSYGNYGSNDSGSSSSDSYSGGGSSNDW